MIARLLLALSLAGPVAGLELRDGDRVVLLGDALLERERHFGDLEAELHARFPEVDFTLRNISWSGDTPDGWSRASFDPAASGWERLAAHLKLTRPTHVILGYGMAASLQEMTERSGDWRLNPDPERYPAMSAKTFQAGLERLANHLADRGVREVVFLSPLAHEELPSVGRADAAVHNKVLAGYRTAVATVAGSHAAAHVDLSSIDLPSPRTRNGIHLTPEAHAAMAVGVLDALGVTAAEKPAASDLREAVARKSDAFFHRFRPANETYLFGFRAHEQGRNAAEMERWDTYLVLADQAVAHSKGLTGEGPEFPDPPTRADEAVELAPPDFTLAENLSMELWAADPLVRKPVAIDFDDRGRLWVAGTPIYPQILPGRRPEDRIYILEDKNRDGRAESSAVFADNLLIPTGVATVPGVDGACYVGASTEVMLLEDTDGDDTADRQRVVLSGFGTEDTHHNIHTFRWGPDGRLYFNQSVYTHSHVETPHGMVRLNAGGVLAYDPDSERLEVFSKGPWNAWGHAWDLAGQSFLTDGAGFNGISWAFPGAIFNPSEGSRRQLPSISPGSYPKFSGLELIHSVHFPEDWQGTAVTCDFRAHRIVRFAIEDLTKSTPPKSGYVTRELEPLVATGDLAFRPIDVKTGPDGALYFADWTNPIINHGEVDFRDPRRDRTSGRIWRLSRTDRPSVEWSPPEVAVARSAEPEKDAASENPRRRIEAMRALAAEQTLENVERVLDLAMETPENDEFHDFAAWRSINDLGDTWIDAVTSGGWTLGGEKRAPQAVFALRSLRPDQARPALRALLERDTDLLESDPTWAALIGDIGGPEEIDRLVPKLAEAERDQILKILVTAARRGVAPTRFAAAKLGDAPLSDDAMLLIGLLKLDALPRLAAALDQDEPPAAAFEALVAHGSPEAADILSGVLETKHSERALIALARLDPERAVAALPDLVAALPDNRHGPFFRELAGIGGVREALTKDFPDNLSQEAYQAAYEALRGPQIPGDPLAAKLAARAGIEPAAGPGQTRSVAGIVHGVQTTSDPALGELVYRRAELACAVCHAIGGVGGKLGPDLTSIGASAPLDYLVESTLHPERTVKEGFHAVTFTMNDGSKRIGIPSRETTTGQFIRTVIGEEEIPKADIASREIDPATASLMPAGLVDSLDWVETRALFAFLGALGKPGPFDASQGGVARLWQLHPDATDPAGLPDAGLPLASLVDGRLTREIVSPFLGETKTLAATRFTVAAAGKVTLDLQGIRRAWVDGTGLPVASEPNPTLNLEAGEHRLVIELDPADLPNHIRASSDDVRFLAD